MKEIKESVTQEPLSRNSTGPNMYSAAEIGPKRDILEGDNAAGLRHYHGVLRYIPF